MKDGTDGKDYRCLRAEMALDGLKDDICDMMVAGALEGISEEIFRKLADMVGFEEVEI